MSIHEFWNNPVNDVIAMFEANIERSHKESKERYEIMRLQTWFLMNIQLDRNNKIKKPGDLFPLDAEKPMEQKSDNPFDPEYDRIFNEILK